MATFNKFYSFTEAIAEKKFNLGSDTLKVALSNTAPSLSNTQLLDITEISYTNLGSRNLTITSSTQASGLYKLVLADLVLTATGAVGPFRYVIIYDDTAANKDLIGYFDYGSSTSLVINQTLTLDFNQAGGLITIT